MEQEKGNYEHRITKLETAFAFIKNQLENHIPTSIKELKINQDKLSEIIGQLKESILPFVRSYNKNLVDLEKRIEDIESIKKDDVDEKVRSKVLNFKIGIVISVISVILTALIYTLFDKL